MKQPDAGLPRLHAPIEACAEGRSSPNVALMQMIIAAGSSAEIDTALARAAAGRSSERIRELVALWRSNPQAYGIVKAVMSDVNHDDTAVDPAQGIAHWARIFDRMAQVSPEAGVALYALGNPDLLQAATDEAVSLLRDWDLLGRDRTVLDLGCGIGRFATALSPTVGHVTGLDISPEMIARARDRCRGLSNVSLVISNGHDLGPVADKCVDLVLASDVFPYLILAGAPVVERHLDDVARVLKPGGAFVVFNYSYRGDFERDLVELAELGRPRCLVIEEAASGLLSHWDAFVYRLRKNSM